MRSQLGPYRRSAAYLVNAVDTASGLQKVCNMTWLQGYLIPIRHLTAIAYGVTVILTLRFWTRCISLCCHIIRPRMANVPISHHINV